MSEARWLTGDVFERLAEIPDGSIDLIVTSPPFLALRSYLPADHPDKSKEIGSEPTPAAFLSTLLALTREWRRVLAPHGSLCVELGDTYSSLGGTTDNREESIGGNDFAPRGPRGGGPGWPLDKSLCLLPTLYPASLAYGRNLLTGEPCEPWRIRNLIVWHRPNPPVGALGDKVRPSTSYITVACMSRTRWFDLDAERTAAKYPDDFRPNGSAGYRGITEGGEQDVHTPSHPAGAPPLDCWTDIDEDVWTLSTQPYKGSHYATFPITLPRKLINLMCPRQVCRECGEPRRRIVDVTFTPHGERREEPKSVRGMGVQNGEHAQAFEHGRATKNVETLGWTDCGHDTWRRGIVLDPFAGSGTTLVAASELGRDSIGIDLDARNHQLARERCGMFLIDEPAEAAS